MESYLPSIILAKLFNILLYGDNQNLYFLLSDDVCIKNPFKDSSILFYFYGKGLLKVLKTFFIIISLTSNI